MNVHKQKKKPAAKLEQIIIPDKEKKMTPTRNKLQFTSDTDPLSNCDATTNDSLPHISFRTENNDAHGNLSLDCSVFTGFVTQHNANTVTQPVTNEPNNVELSPGSKQLKKRGRKRKIPIDPKYTNTDYIVMWPEICMAQKVLVDRYDNVYTYDLDSPRWLGVKTVFGKIDNVTYNTPLTKYYFQ